MTFYKIGEVARLLGLTTQALRFYEQEGVVTPKKSENGTRYYDEDQLILLLSFKKYRQADFSVQDIVTHFKDDHLSGLREQILAQREALLKQSELLRRRADALDAFEKRLAYAQAHLDAAGNLRQAAASAAQAVAQRAERGGHGEPTFSGCFYRRHAGYAHQLCPRACAEERKALPPVRG